MIRQTQVAGGAHAIDLYALGALVMVCALAGSATSQTATEGKAYLWSCVCPSAPWAGRCVHPVVVFQDRLWLFRGAGGASVYYNDVWTSSDGVDWQQIPNNVAWPLRGRIQALVFQGKLWIFVPSYNSTDPVPVWNSSDGEHWTMATSGAPWGPRTHFNVTVFNDMLWMYGGDALGVTGSDDVWNSPDGIGWSRVVEHTGWSVRGFEQGIGAFKGGLWALGGFTGYTPTWLDQAWWSLDGMTWTQAQASGVGHQGIAVEFDGSLWEADRSYHTSGYGGGIYPSKEIWRSEDASHWVRLPDAPWEQRAFQASVTFDGSLWILGGTINDRYLNDVWRLSVVPVTVEGDARPWHKVGEGLTLTVTSPETPSKLSAGVGYQWMLNEVAIAGATEDTYQVDALEESDSGAYTCVLTGDVFGTAGPFQVNVVEGPIPVTSLAGIVAAACGILLAGLALRRKMGK